MAAMLRTIVHTSSAISCVAVAAVAALMAFASPAHAYPIQLLPFDNICLDRIEAEDPQLCLSFLVQSPSARSCLNSGGNLAFGKSSACWNAKRTRLPRGVVPNHTPDIAFPKSQADMIVSCLKQGRSARLASGRVSCLPTPAAVKQVASARARIPGAKIGPPHAKMRMRRSEGDPRCFRASRFR